MENGVLQRLNALLKRDPDVMGIVLADHDAVPVMSVYSADCTDTLSSQYVSNCVSLLKYGDKLGMFKLYLLQHNSPASQSER